MQQGQLIIELIGKPQKSDYILLRNYSFVVSVYFLIIFAFKFKTSSVYVNNVN